MKTYFENKKNIFLINNNLINKIIKNSNNRFGRSRINLHKNFKSNIQEMFIVFRKNSYVEPHYFKKKNTFFRLIKGKFVIKIYSKTKIIKKYILQKSNEMLLIEKGTVYDIICLSKIGIVQELMNGPFNKKLFKKVD